MPTLGPNLPEGVREGETILGKYRIGPILGWGSMGTVVVAHHLHLDKRIAIKFLRPYAVDDRESRERFFREGRTADRIRSDYVVRVFDVGTLTTGEPYIVMECLDGADLAAWLGAHGPATEAQAVDFVLQACDAIGAAHALGVVHRDIKPANLYVVQRGDEAPSIRVLDFGIAKSTGLASTLPPSECSGRQAVTEDNALIGTPLYMSPEQLNSSSDVDARADVWALGVVLYQLLTGRLPFEGGIVELCARIMVPIRPRDSFPYLSRAVDTVLRKCLAPHREQRYSNARELGLALAALGTGSLPVRADRVEPLPSEGSGRCEPGNAAANGRLESAVWTGFAARAAALARAVFGSALPLAALAVSFIAIATARSHLAPAPEGRPDHQDSRIGGVTDPSAHVLEVTVVAPTPSVDERVFKPLGRFRGSNAQPEPPITPPPAPASSSSSQHEPTAPSRGPSVGQPPGPAWPPDIRK